MQDCMIKRSRLLVTMKDANINLAQTPSQYYEDDKRRRSTWSMWKDVKNPFVQRRSIDLSEAQAVQNYMTMRKENHVNK